jgi:hypothetical protein
MSTGPYRLVGQTDSEHAFCALLARIRALWEEAGPPSLEARMSLLAAFAADLRTFGPKNSSTPMVTRCSRMAIGACSTRAAGPSRQDCGRRIG